MSQLGEQLVSLRAVRGMSQRELAQASGLTPTYVRKIEDGTLHNIPSTDAIVSLAHALDADRDELLAAAGRVPSPFDTAIPLPAGYSFTNAVRRLQAYQAQAHSKS